MYFHKKYLKHFGEVTDIRECYDSSLNVEYILHSELFSSVHLNPSMPIVPKMGWRGLMAYR